MATSQTTAPSASARHQQLANEHAALDFQLHQLHQRRYWSPEEEIEATRLKKLKLHVKDAMRSLAGD